MNRNAIYNMVGFQVTSKTNGEIEGSTNSDFDMLKQSKCRKNLGNRSDLNTSQLISNNTISNLENYKIYQCVVCQKIFNQNGKYRNHMRSHRRNSEYQYSCNVCKKSFAVPARLTRHYRTHTGEKPYQCEYCSKSFSVKENLSVHRRIHTNERPYKCDVCKSAFEHSGKLHRHMRIHTGERPHKCSLCSKTFIQSGQLVIHMRTHTGDKPYICKSCKKGFTCSKQLKVHTRIHTGEKPYKCEICSKSFGYNHVLKHHQVGHFGQKFYKCTACHETFNSKRKMELHVKTHSGSMTNNNVNSTELVVKTSSHINKIILYNNNTCTSSNGIVIIQNKSGNGNKLTSVKTENSGQSHTAFSSTHFSLFDQFDQQNSINNHEQSDQTNLKSSVNILRPELNYTENSEVEKSSYHNSSETNSSVDNIYHATNDSIFDTSYSDMQHLFKKRSQNNEGELGNDSGSEMHKSNIKPYSSSVNPIFYANPAEFHVPPVNKTFSLPPRKRCKMILQSMGLIESELSTTKRCNSVIRFAKTDDTKLINY